MLTPAQPAPVDYYQNNCLSLINFVLATHRSILPDQALTLCIAYKQSSSDAQRLLARLLTRKGPIFRTKSLHYREISNHAQAVNELQAQGLIEIGANFPADQLIATLRKDEIVNFWSFPQQLKSARKAALIQNLMERFSDRQINRHLGQHFVWVNIQDLPSWDLLRLLYFGDAMQDWSAFVLRDLGLIEYEDVSFDDHYLGDHKRLAQELHYRRLSLVSHRLNDVPGLAVQLLDLLQAPVPDRITQRRRDKTLLRIGHWSERAGQLDWAASAYCLAEKHPARERLARILHKRDDLQAFERLTAQMLAAPWAEEEVQFVQRFGKRNAGFQPSTSTVEVDTVSCNVEQQAIELLTETQGWGAHVENALVRSLTGLLYWPVIFTQLPGAFTNPFQSGPNDLYYDDFAQSRTRQLDQHEQLLADDEQLTHYLARIYTSKLGLANSLVNWSVLERVGLNNIITAIPADHIRRLSQYLIRHLYNRRSGLPDLLVVYGPGEYELVEVKGPNDQLQPGQRVWLRTLAQMEIPSRVLRIKLARHQ